MESGCYLRTNIISIEKEQFDYPRVLIATTSLDIINTMDTTMVDEMLLEVKIVEEWGFNVGEDACLFEEENDYVSAHYDHEEIGIGNDVQNTVDYCVKAISLLCLIIFLCLFDLGFAPIFLLLSFSPYFVF